MADNSCDTCVNFDPVLRGVSGGKLRDTIWGWCAKKSVYPCKEGPGQVFPNGVARVDDPAVPAKPYLVKRGQVVRDCPMYVKSTAIVSKAQLLEKLNKQGAKLSKR